MRFVVLPQEGQMVIDNQVLQVDGSSLASNVEIIAFNGEDGIGGIEYNDRPRLFDRSSLDPAQYEPLINAWMTAALAQWSSIDPAVALQQARQIKSGYVDALFHSKRQAPIGPIPGFTGTQAGRIWNADDESVNDIADQIAAWDIAAGVNTEINNNGINTSSTTSYSLSNNTITPASTAPYVGTLIPANHYFIFSPTSRTNMNPTVSATTSSGPSSKANIAIAGPNFPIIPRGETAPESVSMANARILLGQISDRRDNLNQTRLQKQADINADPTIAAVIARSATGAWPS